MLVLDILMTPRALFTDADNPKHAAARIVVLGVALAVLCLLCAFAL